MKKPITSGLAGAFLAFGMMAGSAAAQCEGGVTVAGRYLPDGSYMPGGCAYSNPTTPGQLYPSGAQPAPSTNPAQGGSHLPGQRQPSDLIPVNSSDLGPAPSMVNVAPDSIRPAVGGQNAGPGVSIRPNVAPAGYVMAPASGGALAPGAVGPAQLPPSGSPALTGNRAEPAANEYPGRPLGVGTATIMDTPGATARDVAPAGINNIVQPPANVDPDRVQRPGNADDSTLRPPGNVTIGVLEEMWEDEDVTGMPAAPQPTIPTGPSMLPSEPVQNTAPGTIVIPDANP